MKHKNIIALLAMLLATVLPVLAQEEKIDNYTVDFNDIQITEGYGTSLPDDWTPKSGWGHIVKASFSGKYKGYSASHDSYLTSPCLHVDYENNADWDPTNTGDYLVSPNVSGTVTMKVAGASYRYGVMVLKAQKDNFGGYTLGDTLYYNGDTYSEFNGKTGTLARNEWNDISFTVDGVSCVAIRAYAVNIDDFTASSAWITKEKKVNISNITRTQPKTTDADTDADGNFDVSYDVTLTNNGDFDLSAGEAELRLVNAADTSMIYARTPFPGMETGETSEPLVLSATIHTDDYQPVSLLVKETLNGKTQDAGTITPIEYKADPVLRNGSVKLDGSSVIDFGTSQKAISKSLTLINDGAADYVISSVSVPTGFSTDLEPRTIKPHANVGFTVTKDAGAAGTFADSLIIRGNAANIHVLLTGTTVDEKSWFVDFEDNAIPADMEAQALNGNKWVTASLPYTMRTEGNNYMAKTTGTDTLRLFSPKVIIAEGDKLTFDAAKSSDSESSLDVYYSSDRQNWTLVKSINCTNDSTQTTDIFSNENTGGDYSSYYQFKTYSVDNIPVGEVWLAFEGRQAELDNIAGYKVADVKNDIIIRSADIPSQGEVNSGYQATVTVKNNTRYDIEAETYKIGLQLGDNVNFAVSNGPAMKSGESAEVKLTATPHAAGTFAAFAYVDVDGTTTKSADTNVTIADEGNEATIQVGNDANATGSYYIPYRADKTSEGEVVYTAEELAAAGITNGVKIGSVSFTGAITGTWNASNLEAVIGNSTQGVYTANDVAERTMTDQKTLHTGEYAYIQQGSYSTWGGTPTWADIMTFTLSEPFVYTGGSIVMHFNNTNESNPWYSYVYFKADNQYFYHAILRYIDSDDDVLPAQAYTTQNYLPITKFGVIRDAAVVSGTVTGPNGAVVEGVKVTAISGNVEYSAISDAQGKYSLNVIKSDLTYELYAEKAGYKPSLENGVKFQSGDNSHDINLTEATGLFVRSAAIPAKGIVNEPVTATVTVLNPMITAVNDYKVSFIIDGENAKNAESITALQSMDKITYTIAVTPHTVGTIPAHFEVVYSNDTARSEIYQIDVAEEQFSTTVQVLDSTAATSTGPIMNNLKSETQTIYTADQLRLPANSQITRLVYRGYTTDSYSGNINRDINVEVWLDNVEASADDYTYGTDYASAALDMNSETPVYEGTIHLAKDGSSDSIVAILDIPVEGFTYTGKNLRVSVYQETNSTDGYIYWINQENARQMFQRSAYSESDNISDVTWTKSYSTPVIWIEAVNSAIIQGKITNEDGEAVAGAQITITKGDVSYATTSNANGEYTLTISHFDAMDFTATVSANEYIPDTASVAATAGQTITHDVVLKKEVIDGINALNAMNLKSSRKGIYNVAGQYLGNATDIKSLKPGLYIIDGNKVVIK